MIDQLIADTRRHAAHIEHEWDAQAIGWPLTMSSVVVDVGGYCGRWALQIAERYHPRLFVFEPQAWAVDVCRALLGDMARVYNAALGDRDATLPMGAWGSDGCSFVTACGSEVGQMREIKGMLDQCQITQHIDLMLMNIEGYEYTLLPHMLDRGIHPQRLMVQFHDHADLDGSKRAAITARLSTLGYRVLWDYWALTAWERV